MFDRLILSLLILLTSFFTLLYLGEITPPKTEPPLSVEEIKKNSQFFDKKQFGIHHLVLSGNDFQRGQQSGFWTKHLLVKQEQSLIQKINKIFPSSIIRHALFVLSMGWFSGLDDYYEDDWKQEMYGVSLHTPLDRLYFSNIYTRQLAYHAVHDMGQMMIDNGLVLGACTQIAVPKNNGWLIGRNFDFEAGPVFDEDKVIKWVFPKTGEPYVSVLFSGMVGVITGINIHGVYIALNAAGSDDFVRLGTPTNLVVYKALRNSKNAQEAVEIIKKSSTLITDIFVVADKGDTLYIIEKSPKKFAIRTSKKSQVVTNHFESPLWKNDANNSRRIKSTTSLHRQNRGKALLPMIEKSISAPHMLKALRDKHNQKGSYVPGHRSSIDALIASHSVIYDSATSVFYVSSGDSLTREFYGYNLNQSFQQRRPIPMGTLSPDPDVSPQLRHNIKQGLKVFESARRLVKLKNCNLAQEVYSSVPKSILTDHYARDWTHGDISFCQKEKSKAITFWNMALKKHPAYAREFNQIRENISDAQ